MAHSTSSFPARRARRRTRLGTAVAAAALAALAAPSAAQAFGTVSLPGLGQRSEHERVTRLALQCGGNVQPPLCFQPVSLDNLAGKNGTFGAVGAPDDLPLHLKQDREYWHCDNADWVDPALHGLASYPQSRTQALDRLRDCIAWGKSKLYDGQGDWNLATATPSTGAIAEARSLIKSNGRVDDSNPGVGFLNPTCTYNGVRGRAKCNVLEPFGYVLHMVEDFYSHTNWADFSVPGQPLSLGNPYGLGSSDIAPFLDLRRPLPGDAEIPANFTGGCYPKKNCAGRVIHGESDDDRGLNKDKVNIDVATGAVTDPRTPRGQIVVDGISNAQRAVTLAARDARRQWDVFRAELAQRYGADRGAKMICALVLDQAQTCDTRNIVLVVDTGPARRVVTGSTVGFLARAAQADRDDQATVAAGERLLSRLEPTDRVAVVTFDSSTGDQDVDPFVKPSKARIDDATTGDRAKDPKVKGDGRQPSDDPTITPEPDPVVDGPISDHPGHVHGTEEGAEETEPAASTEPVARMAQAGSAVREAPADALATAGGLLDDRDAPRGQQGVVMVTNRLGDVAELAARIRQLGDQGVVVSLANTGGEITPQSIVAAIEQTGGTVLSSTDAADIRRFAKVADTSGLTTLDDPHGPDQEATLDAGHPDVEGVTGVGADTHDVEALDDDATLTVRAVDQKVTVTVIDHATGETETLTARRGKPAKTRLGSDGNYEVAVDGDGRGRYEIGVDG